MYETQGLRGQVSGQSGERGKAARPPLGALLAGKLTEEDIEARVRNRPVRAVIADICRDLGLPEDSPMWRELQEMAVVSRREHDSVVLAAIRQLRRDRAAGLMPKPMLAFGTTKMPRDMQSFFALMPRFVPPLGTTGGVERQEHAMPVPAVGTGPH